MLICPFCRAEVPDDSHFCDQCGKEFLFCPECGKPKRGTMCAACGSELIKAGDFFADAGKDDCGGVLSGEGLTLRLTEGDFGRRCGIWPEFADFPYISGIHGHIGRQDSSWTITDLGSTNGTKVNGKPLRKDEPVRINPGDVVEIATSKFTVK